MISIWETPFVVVDVETTGSDPEKNRITDIACITVLGGSIISEFSSLVNPHQFIPPYIAKMTGISNDLAFTAPEASAVMPEIFGLLSRKDAVFVAHNARFDWSFVYHSLIRAGFSPPLLQQLCTLKLARRLLSKKDKKNVGFLANFFNIPVINRHRAYSDARATALILLELLDLTIREHNISTTDELLNLQNKPVRNFKPAPLAMKRVEKTLETLPDSPGVYYFYGRAGRILYVGKAKSLKERVRSYFNFASLTSKKISELIHSLYKIEYRVTETELEALILESKEIKRLKPMHNVLDKDYRPYPFLRLTVNEDFPKLEFVSGIENDGAEYFGPFRSPYLADSLVKKIEKEYKLRKCLKVIKPNSTNKPCFYHHIKRCHAPCAGLISKEEYAKEVEKVRSFLSGNSGGIICELETQMGIFSSNLNFEKAAELRNQIEQLKKVFERRQDISASVNEHSLIVILPESAREKTLDIYFIKSGMFAGHLLVGRRASLEKLFDSVSHYFFNGYAVHACSGSLEEIDEMRIVGSWLYRQQECSSFIYTNGKSEAELRNELESAIRNFNFPNYAFAE